ncbi:MAG TPA: cytochrome c oxidase assembly protein [Candidatus Binatia bacterium]
MTRAALESLRFDPWLIAALVATGVVYVRGWRALHAQMPARFGVARLAAFLAGLVVLLVAVASPLDAFAPFLLTVHMVQHLLITMVAAPLLLLGAPQMPLLRGLPRAVAREALGPFLAAPELRALGRALSHPLVCLTAFVATTWLWHVPALYELALRSDRCHQVEHATFLATALLFWWPVVAPWPSVMRWPRWTVIPYLVVADLANTALSALLSFSEEVIYPSYAAAPRLAGTTALGDQSAAGALMWLVGAICSLVPAAVISVQLLSPRLVRPGETPAEQAASARAVARALLGDPRERARAARARGAFDLLDVPALGALLRSRRSRQALRFASFALAALIVADGLLGPQMSPMNLAGVLPWTWVRALAVVVLLAAGNWFCAVCPFLVPRELGRRVLPARLAWPRALRSKWLAVGVLVAWFVVYEVADVWDSPWWTAWLVVGYAAGALAVDGLFRGASFCKYVCPIGQLQFAYAALSPFEVRVKQPEACATCTTHDCIRGNAHARGCELALYLPRKAGNLDCTFCLDCADACPHGNVGVLAVAPAVDLIRDPRRSSLGRLSMRVDVAALALVLVFAAFANAAGMVAPVVRWQDALVRRLALPEGAVATALLVLALVPLPLALAVACAALGRALSGCGATLRELVCRFARALLPLGAGMWLAHLLFHLATGGGALWPVVQRGAADLGVAALGRPDWGGAAPHGDLAWLTPTLVLILDVGLLLTLWVAWRIAVERVDGARRQLALALPWTALGVALYAAGVWMLLQPMEMRGTMVHS